MLRLLTFAISKYMCVQHCYCRNSFN